MAEFRVESRGITGVVLGGGRGTRLHPLTADTSKHLLPIGDKPMIVRTIEQLLDADVKDIILLIDHRYASQFLQILQDGTHLGARSLSYVWQHPEGKGLPSAINQVSPHIKTGKIVVACGDVLIDEGIRKPIDDFMRQKQGARLTATYVEDSAGYSPLEVQNEQITNIHNKDKSRHEPSLIDLGVYMYHSDVFGRIDNLSPSARGETEIWNLNMDYVTDHVLGYTAVHGWWSDAGNDIATYQEAHQHYDKTSRH